MTAVCGRAVIELLGDGAPGRHREVERRAAAQRALDLDTSAVGLDEALADLQTKSRSAALGFLCLPESVEDVREALGCNASAGVCDPKSYFAVAGRCPYGDATARRSELERVADQVPQYLETAIAVAPGLRQCSLDFAPELKRRSGRDMLLLFDHAQDELVGGKRAKLDGLLPRFDARHVKKILI